MPCHHHGAAKTAAVVVRAGKLGALVSRKQGAERREAMPVKARRHGCPVDRCNTRRNAGVRLVAELVWLTALAGAKARPLRLGARAMETDMARLGVARRAGRPAIDARGRHRNIERAVGAAIACDHGRPAWILLGRQLGEVLDRGVHRFAFGVVVSVALANNGVDRAGKPPAFCPPAFCRRFSLLTVTMRWAAPPALQI